MRRSLLNILLVAGIAAWISSGERAVDVSAAPSETSQWVRTSSGWQTRHTLKIDAGAAAPTLHPGLVAAFQLGASLFCLVAFPARVSAAGRAAPVADRRHVGRRAPLATAAS